VSGECWEIDAVTIRAVLFDYVGTMTEDMKPVVAELARASGAELAEVGELLLGDYGPAESNSPLHRVERGEAPFSELAEWGRAEGLARGWTLDLGMLVRDLMALPIRDVMVERVRYLRSRDIRTALVTNNMREFGPQWRRQLPLGDLFDEVIDSSEVGFRKPEPEIFHLTLERLRVAPAEAVLLDDIPANLSAAGALGMHGILVQPDCDVALAQLDALLVGTLRQPAG
jgi:HAD superfamily hydrolase (TIGR01509 family)